MRPVKVAELDAMGDISPDGRQLTFVDWSTGDLAIRDLDTGEDRRLTNKGSWLESSEFAEYSIISPDGASVAYAWRRDDGTYELRLVGIDVSGDRPLARGSALEYILPAVLFEMLSGKRPFEGRDVSEVLGAVLRLDPDWNALPAETPPRISTLARRCLEKEPKQRVHDVADVRLAMEGAFETRVPQPDNASVAPRLRVWQRPVPVVLTVLAALGLGAFAVWAFLGSGIRQRRIAWISRDGNTHVLPVAPAMYRHLELSPSEAQLAVDIMDGSSHSHAIHTYDFQRESFTRLAEDSHQLVWSSDETRFAFGSSPVGQVNIFLKPTGAEVEPLTDSKNLQAPWSWSSDGRFLAYYEWDNQLEYDLWLLPIGQADQQPVSLVSRPFNGFPR